MSSHNHISLFTRTLSCMWAQCYCIRAVCLWNTCATTVDDWPAPHRLIIIILNNSWCLDKKTKAKPGWNEYHGTLTGSKSPHGRRWSRRLPSTQHVSGLIFNSIRQAEKNTPGLLWKDVKLCNSNEKFWHKTVAKCQSQRCAGPRRVDLKRSSAVRVSLKHSMMWCDRAVGGTMCSLIHCHLHTWWLDWTARQEHFTLIFLDGRHERQQKWWEWWRGGWGLQAHELGDSLHHLCLAAKQRDSRSSPSVLLTVSMRRLYSWILSLWCWNSLFRFNNSSLENFPELLAWWGNSHWTQNGLKAAGEREAFFLNREEWQQCSYLNRVMDAGQGLGSSQLYAHVKIYKAIGL